MFVENSIEELENLADEPEPLKENKKMGMYTQRA